LSNNRAISWNGSAVGNGWASIFANRASKANSTVLDNLRGGDILASWRNSLAFLFTLRYTFVASRALLTLEDKSSLLGNASWSKRRALGHRTIAALIATVASNVSALSNDWGSDVLATSWERLALSNRASLFTFIAPLASQVGVYSYRGGLHLETVGRKSWAAIQRRALVLTFRAVRAIVAIRTSYSLGDNVLAILGKCRAFEDRARLVVARGAIRAVNASNTLGVLFDVLASLWQVRAGLRIEGRARIIANLATGAV
jgi:hypothetical protein